MTEKTKPVVSILMVAYAAASTIEAAIEGALSQNFPCEIIISDDASPDDTFAIAQKKLTTYQGPHHIILRRNEINQGVTQHVNTLMKLATGSYFVFMAGDDISYPDRVRMSIEKLTARQDVYALGSAYDEIDMQGLMLRKNVEWNLPEEFGIENFSRSGKMITLLGATMVIRRELYDRFGPLRGGVEDNVLTFRAALLGRLLNLKEVYIQYRQNPQSLSNWFFARGDNSPQAFRRRYERTLKLYRDTADDLEHCVTELGAALDSDKSKIALDIIRIYRLEAEVREAILDRPKLQWLSPIWRGLMQPGLRRKSLERALKLFFPRSWFGLKA